MRLLALFLLTTVVLHVAGPYPTFMRPKLVGELSPRLVGACLLHAIVEEYIFRHLFWSKLRAHKTSPHVVTLVWINVLAFWLVHVLLLYHSRLFGLKSALAVYETIPYHLSIVFAGIMFNAIYFESTPFPYASCAAAHACLLLTWSVCFAGEEDDYYTKYELPRPVQRMRRMVTDFVRQGV